MNTFGMVFAVAWRKPDAAQIEVSFFDLIFYIAVDSIHVFAAKIAKHMYGRNCMTDNVHFICSSVI